MELSEQIGLGFGSEQAKIKISRSQEGNDFVEIMNKESLIGLFIYF